MSTSKLDAQYANADELKMQRLVSWLNENGVTFPSLEIKIVNGLRGVYATQKIQSGEVVLHVPRPAMVTVEVARHSEIGKKIAQHVGEKLSDYGYMAAFIIETRRAGGFWKPYFDVLPSTFPGMPIFYDQKHLSYLKGCHIEQSITSHKKVMKSDYDLVKKFFDNLSLHEFSLVRMSVTTRVYQVTTDGYTTLAMVPLADMLNHTNPSPTHWTGRASNGFTIMAMTDLQSGGEILESYGSRSNGRWLMSHGLCMGQNPENLAEIELPKIRHRHPFFHLTKDLGRSTRTRRIFPVTQAHWYEETLQMFSYLRLSCMSDMPAINRMLKKIPCKSADVTVVLPGRAAPKPDPVIVPPVSRQNEIAALTALAAACKRDMQRYKTTLEDDEEALKNPDLVWTMRFAIMAAVSEKRILKHYLDLAKLAIDALSGSPFKLARVVADEVRTGRPYEWYFKELQEHLSEFSPMWYVSRLPVRKQMAAAKKIHSVKQVTHSACA